MMTPVKKHIMHVFRAAAFAIFSASFWNEKKKGI